MNLEHLLTFHAELGDKGILNLGTGPYGTRMVSIVKGGAFEGPRLKGTVHPGGGDYLLADEDGAWHLDVRLIFETDDGALIYVQYFGVLVMNEKAAAARAEGKPLDFGDMYFMTQPRFETGDERYSWLNSVVAVGEGRLNPGKVEYKIYALENG